MQVAELNNVDLDPERLSEIGASLDPSLGYAPADELAELMEMVPEGLSLGDAWIMRHAGISRQQLVFILSHGFVLVKGPPGEDMLPALLTDHDLQLLEETDFDVEPMRKLMSLGYSIVFTDQPSTLPHVERTTPRLPVSADDELSILEQAGFDITTLKFLLNKGYALVPAQLGSVMPLRTGLSSAITTRLTQDGFILIEPPKLKDSPPFFSVGSPVSVVGPPSPPHILEVQQANVEPPQSIRLSRADTKGSVDASIYNPRVYTNTLPQPRPKAHVAAALPRSSAAHYNQQLYSVSVT